jgi:hypothetical protein
MKIKSEHAFIIYSILLTGGFILSTFLNNAPFLVYASQFTIGFGAYITKRLLQKKEGFNNEKNNQVDR